ncbi:MAG: TonB-dependent receptor plug domain-containing protein [Phenylobacterium sp.]|uniref:TonB-dependent receptor plug domain-containing protein n=1 Tax=Phenylobacterium sp. TaxID=1871053 RepID=UPI00391A90DA
MLTNHRRAALFAGAAFAALAFHTAAAAEDEAIRTAEEPVTASELVVPGQIHYRNRTEDTAPALTYELDYFQRFEPLTAGDALKRVPSVAFLSDVLESDGARLRGLDPTYTQVLINGEKVPGSGVDRSFFVDRIPAELIERIEVVRSASANRSGDAMAGTLNIVLRDAYALDGGFVRAGALYFNDGRVRETIGGVYSTEVGPGRLLIGANLQGRRNPKEKRSLRYSEPPASDANFSNREDQTDLRNGTDYSANLNYTMPLSGGELELGAFYIKTDRTQDENSWEYDALVGGTMETVNHQVVDIDQENITLSARYEREMLGGKTTLKLGYANFTENDVDTEEETDFTRNPDRFTGDLELTDLDDTETTAKLAHKRPLGAAELEVGLQYQKKERDTRIVTDRNRFNLPGTNPAYGPFVDVDGGVNSIEETRLDPYVMLSGDAGPVRWEAGLRYETTDVTIVDETAPAADRSNSKDYAILLPSAHLRWSLTPQDRITLSVARTIRRPGFNEISPALLTAELGDNDYLGNPDLEPETAWGIDVGYERRLGRTGVAGVNFFYRDVQDLIEIANTGDEGDEGPGTFVLTSRNAGDGQVWGVEFDVSAPLTAFGLKDTGVFLNYSWLDSDVTDEFGSRRFNSQADYVFNVGFIQDLPAYGAAFGVTYRKQGDAYGRIVGEEVTTSYGGDLEMFAEKRIGKSVTVRFTASNILNGTKDEVFNKFNTIEDQIDRSFDEYELETEEAGPVYQLIARVAF